MSTAILDFTRQMKSFSLLCAAAAIALMTSCAKPEPPKITPLSARVATVSLAGLDLEVKLRAENDNGMDLDMESVAAHVVVDGNNDLGVVTIPNALHLPAKKSVEMTVPIHATWSNLAALVPLAQKNANVPYEVDGKVKLTNALGITVPFKITGTITHEQLLKIAQSAIPKVPGVNF